MAITKSIVTAHGLEIAEAYHRVECVALDGKNRLRFHLRRYKDPQLPFFAEEVVLCEYDINGANPIAQAYAHLKTLPEFADAQDC